MHQEEYYLDRLTILIRNPNLIPILQAAETELMKKFCLKFYDLFNEHAKNLEKNVV